MNHPKDVATGAKAVVGAAWELVSGIRPDAARYISPGGHPSAIENIVVRAFRGDCFFFFAYLEGAMACDKLAEYTRYFGIPYSEESYTIVLLLQYQAYTNNAMFHGWKKRVEAYQRSLQLQVAKEKKNHLYIKSSPVVYDEANGISLVPRRAQETVNTAAKKKGTLLQPPPTTVSVLYARDTAVADVATSLSSATASPSVPRTKAVNTGIYPRETKEAPLGDGTAEDLSTKSKVRVHGSIEQETRHEQKRGRADNPIIIGHDDSLSDLSPTAGSTTDMTVGTEHQPIIRVDDESPTLSDTKPAFEKKHHDDPLRSLPNDKSRWSAMDYVVGGQFDGDYFALFRSLDQIMTENKFSARAFMRRHNIPESGKYTLFDIVRLLQNRDTVIVSPVLTKRVQAYQRAGATKPLAGKLSSRHKQTGLPAGTQASPDVPLVSSTNQNPVEGNLSSSHKRKDDSHQSPSKKVKQDFGTLRYFDGNRSSLDYVVRRDFHGDYFQFLARLDQKISENGDRFSAAEFLRQNSIPKAGYALLLYVVLLLQKGQPNVLSQIWMDRVEGYRKWKAETKEGYPELKEGLPNDIQKKDANKSTSVDILAADHARIAAIDKAVQETFQGNVDDFLSSLQDANDRGEVSAFVRTHSISQAGEYLASIVALMRNKDAKVELPANWKNYISAFRKRKTVALKELKKLAGTEPNKNMDASMETLEIKDLEKCVEEKFDGDVPGFLRCLYHAENEGEGIPMFARKSSISHLRRYLYAIGSLLRNIRSPVRLPEEWEQHTTAFYSANTAPPKPAPAVSWVPSPRSTVASNSKSSVLDPMRESPNTASEVVSNVLSNDEMASTARDSALDVRDPMLGSPKSESKVVNDAVLNEERASPARHNALDVRDPMLESPNSESEVFNDAASNDETICTSRNNVLDLLVRKRFRGDVPKFLNHVRDAAQEDGFRAAVFARKRNIPVEYVDAIVKILRNPAGASHGILPETWNPHIIAVRSNTQKTDAAVETSTKETSKIQLPGVLVRRLPKYPAGAQRRIAPKSMDASKVQSSTSGVNFLSLGQLPDEEASTVSTNNNCPDDTVAH
eukprot:scaffold1071_cov166-Amphora_coffeaeformis.AAC.10